MINQKRNFIYIWYSNVLDMAFQGLNQNSIVGSYHMAHVTLLNVSNMQYCDEFLNIMIWTLFYSTRKAKKTYSIFLRLRSNQDEWWFYRASVYIGAITDGLNKSNICHRIDNDLECFRQWIIYYNIANCSLFTVKYVRCFPIGYCALLTKTNLKNVSLTGILPSLTFNWPSYYCHCPCSN